MHGTSFWHLNFIRHLYTKINVYCDLDGTISLIFFFYLWWKSSKSVSVSNTFIFVLLLEVLQWKTFRNTGSSSFPLFERWEKSCSSLCLGSEKSSGKTDLQTLILHSFHLNLPQGPRLYGRYSIQIEKKCSLWGITNTWSKEFGEREKFYNLRITENW